MWKGSLNQRKHSGFKKTILKDINVIELLHWIYGAKIVPHLATENGKRLNTFADLCRPLQFCCSARHVVTVLHKLTYKSSGKCSKSV